MLGNFAAFLSSVDFFFKLIFFKNVSLEYHQCVRPDLGPDCLQRLSADDKIHHSWGWVCACVCVGGGGGGSGCVGRVKKSALSGAMYPICHSC